MDSDSDFSDDDNIKFVKIQEKLKSRKNVDSDSDDEQERIHPEKKQQNQFSSQYSPLSFGNIQTPSSFNSFNSQSKIFTPTQYNSNSIEFSNFNPNDASYGVSGDMTHNNMMPFFKSKTYGHDNGFNERQTEHSIRNVNLMTGSDQNLQFKHKQEVKALFDPVVNKVDSVTGTPNFNDFHQSRFVPSQYRQGEKPFQPIYVAKGLNLGYGSQGHGGIIGGDNYRALPKNIDQLRTLNNQRITYTLPTIAGQKGHNRGIIGEMNKNGQDRFHYNDINSLIPNSAIENAPSLYGKVNLKDQQRSNENTHLNPSNGGKHANYFINPNNLIPNATNRENMQSNLTNISNGVKSYLFNSINAIPNETLRSLLSEKIYISNANGNYKQGQNLNYTPNETTLKETTENNIYLAPLSGAEQSYLFNHLNAIPDQNLRNLINSCNSNNGNFSGNFTQLKLYNYDDVQGTNLRNIIENNNHSGNFSGNYDGSKLFNYDDTPQKTLRNITENNNHSGNFSGNYDGSKLFNYDDMPQTTLRNITENNNHSGNFSGNYDGSKLFNYDDTPQTTLRNIIENTNYAGTFTGNYEASRLFNYDDTPQTTMKEINENNKNILNIIGNYSQGKTRELNAVSRHTLKECIENSQHLLNVASMQKQSKLFNYDDKAKTTLRELIENTKNISNVASTILKQGKLFNYDDVPDITLRNLTENNKHIIGTKGYTQEGKSHFEKTLLNTQKEILLKKREPTNSNVSKSYNNSMTEYTFKNDNHFVDNDTLTSRNSSVRSNLGIKNELFNC